MTSHGQTSYQRSLALPLLAILFGQEALVAALQLDLQNWFWLLWMGGISSGLAYVFYYKGLQGSNVVIASVATLLGPVIGVTLSVLLLHESFTAVQVAGIVGLLVTVYFLSTSNLWPDGQPVAAGQIDDNVQLRIQTLMEVVDVARREPCQTERATELVGDSDVTGRWSAYSCTAVHLREASDADRVESA